VGHFFKLYTQTVSLGYSFMEFDFVLLDLGGKLLNILLIASDFRILLLISVSSLAARSFSGHRPQFVPSVS
jgi:hypothetical protein